MQSLLHRDLTPLFDVLRDRGYRLVGPTVRDGAIVLDTLDSAADLPVGWKDEQAPGKYRLHRRDDDARFGFVVGPQSFKKVLLPPRETLVQIRRGPQGPVAQRPLDDEAPLALIGARACDLAALAIHDRVFQGSTYTDPRYADRRRRAFVVAVDCLEAGEQCFCTSADGDPEVREGFDLRLTELPSALLVEAGTDAGRDVLAALPTEATTPDQREARLEGLQHARRTMRPAFAHDNVAGLLLGNLDHPQWDIVAERCLSCGSCTQVCPTCFCFDVRPNSVLERDEATTERTWDSCFGLDHGTIHGAVVRPTTRDRYRQWLTHKLGSWVTQFGTSGCVGCGRCVTWCPVGIDLREEVAAIAKDAAPVTPAPKHEPAAPVVGDPLLPTWARVTSVVREHEDVFTLALEPPGPFAYEPGQFNMLSLPGVGDVPISIAGRRGAALLHTIRAVGATTKAITSLEVGAAIGLRGPFGHGWPLAAAAGREVTVVAGGLGLAPLRDSVLRMLEDPDAFPRVRLLYGARTPDDILYDDLLLEWNVRYPQFKASVTVDHATAGWTGHVGVVTRLLRLKELSPAGIYFVCGPEVMMKFVLESLRNAGVPSTRIYVAMERNMKCAAGFCGRCQFGPYFVCKDGPVFRHDKIEFLFGRPGF
jgi:NAD(P)H-flavin reductase/formate hydrogenlyase subunit 6/NADH:ubiquinone oxidoreductase subunit I